MRLSRASLLLLAVFVSLNLTAQKNLIRTSWESHPKTINLDPKYASEGAVVLFDERRIEYIDIKESTEVYRTLHRRIRLNNDKGIESYNRVYLPVSENRDIVDIKARTILPDGKIIELDRNAIKEIKENDRVYKIFALEGLVKGCEIEFYYTYNMGQSFFGRESFQGNHPVLRSKLELASPERLVFETKNYNCRPAARKDTTIRGKRILTVEMDEFSGVEDEKYANYKSNVARVEYKLSYNLARSATERIFTWNDLVKRVYNMTHVFTEKEIKKISAFVNSQQWKNIAGEKEKIVAVENYLKKNFAVREDITSEQAMDLEWILKNKITNERGMTKLFNAALTQLKVPHELVLCGSREDYPIDEAFENWNNTDNFLIYFPNLKKFLAPALPVARFPWIDPAWGNTGGVLCREITIGNFTTSYAVVGEVSLEDYRESSINTKVDLRLNEDADTLELKLVQSFTGYATFNYRAGFNFSGAEDRQLLLKNLIKTITGTDHILSSAVENEDFSYSSENEPFYLKAHVKSSEMVERAGAKILVKIGEAIGPQAELYQEKERKLPIEVDYPHILYRNIKFEIPEGYVIRNVEDLRISAYSSPADEIAALFESDYTISGNILKVTVKEEYRTTRLPVSEYEHYKKVINAAADFNKIVLVLEKK